MSRRFKSIKRVTPDTTGEYELKCDTSIGHYYSQGIWDGEKFINRFDKKTPLVGVVGWRNLKSA